MAINLQRLGREEYISEAVGKPLHVFSKCSAHIMHVHLALYVYIYMSILIYHGILHVSVCCSIILLTVTHVLLLGSGYQIVEFSKVYRM